jgi:hypothetical protein
MRTGMILATFKSWFSLCAIRRRCRMADFCTPGLVDEAGIERCALQMLRDRFPGKAIQSFDGLEPITRDHWMRRARSALTAAGLRQPVELSAWVGDMKTSAGMDYFVCVGHGKDHGQYLTPNVYKIRGRAEYDAACWNHLLGRCEKPDVLAFDTEATTAQRAAAALPAGWRCFHCGEEFTDSDAAALHFGTHEYQEPACLIDIAKFREMEALQRRYADEDADVHRAMRRMDSDHQQALRRAEEDGYAKGLQDAVKDSTEAAQQAEATAVAAPFGGS